jgi:hypothetical protein
MDFTEVTKCRSGNRRSESISFVVLERRYIENRTVSLLLIKNAMQFIASNTNVSKMT